MNSIDVRSVSVEGQAADGSDSAFYMPADKWMRMLYSGCL
jgi:hypothetical protein